MKALRRGSLLDQPSTHVAAALASGYLDQANRALRQCLDAKHPDALHDFRVAVRRLRSCLRAYQKELGEAAVGKIRRRLADITDSTNPGRDAEVSLEWLKSEQPSLHPAHQPGFAYLCGRFQSRRDLAYEMIERTTNNRFLKLTRRLEQRLRDARRRTTPARHERFGLTVAARVRSEASILRRELDKFQGATDEKHAHKARIAGKRLRYLLEPLQDVAPAAKELVRVIKTLQDLLGHYHDAVGIADEAQRALRETVELHDSKRLLRSGLRALAKRAVAARDVRFTELSSEWDAEKRKDFFRQIALLARSLVGPSA